MCKKSPLRFLRQVDFDKFSMIVMIFLTNGQMLLVKYNQ
jgi:hypothetical protein